MYYGVAMVMMSCHKKLLAQSRYCKQTRFLSM